MLGENAPYNVLVDLNTENQGKLHRKDEFGGLQLSEIPYARSDPNWPLPAICAIEVGWKTARLARPSITSTERGFAPAPTEVFRY